MELEYYPPAKDRRNPKSIINCVTGKYQALIENVADDLLEMPETELSRLCFGKHGPDENWARLKINFWREYEASQKEFGGKVDFRNVGKGVCGERHLLKLFTEDHARFAFILSRPLEYATQMEDLHALAINEMRSILTMEVGYDPETMLPDTKLLQAKIQIFKYVDSKQKGAPVIKTESTQKNLNVNVEATPEDLQKFKSVEEIDERLKELERLANQALPPGTNLLDVTEVLPTDRSVSHNGGRHVDCIPLED